MIEEIWLHNPQLYEHTLLYGRNVGLSLISRSIAPELVAFALMMASLKPSRVFRPRDLASFIITWVNLRRPGFEITPAYEGRGEELDVVYRLFLQGFVAETKERAYARLFFEVYDPRELGAPKEFYSDYPWDRVVPMVVLSVRITMTPISERAIAHEVYMNLERNEPIDVEEWTARFRLEVDESSPRRAVELLSSGRALVRI